MKTLGLFNDVGTSDDASKLTSSILTAHHDPKIGTIPWRSSTVDICIATLAGSCR